MVDRIALCGDKATPLLKLSGRLRTAKVPPCVLLNLRHWHTDPDKAISEVLHTIKGDSLAVRSARNGEDSHLGNAGRYLSLLDVAADPEALSHAVRRIFESYGPLRDNDHVLVQPQIKGITHAIVASTRGAFASAYDSVSYAEGNAPDAITRGDCPADTWYLDPAVEVENLPRPVIRALRLLDELRSKIDSTPFEVELLDTDETLWLLQVRRLPGSLSTAETEKTIQCATTQLNQYREDGANLLGLMPDWNPAELLGAHPRPFALSLFQSVIGDASWWRARAELGYSRPYADQLIRPVAGRPYVDVRASFESLCPAELSLEERARLSGAWLGRLRANPQLHDRVEFDVVVSGFEFDAAARLAELDCGVAQSRLVPLLRKLTTGALDAGNLRQSIRYFSQLLMTPAPTRGSLKDRIPFLRDHVAQRFARVARSDFLAQALWRSASRRGAIASHRCLDVLAIFNEEDSMRGSAAGRHARPSQFDIRSLERSSERYQQQVPKQRDRPYLALSESRNMIELLEESSLAWSPEQLLEISRLAARARELGKRVLAALLGDWLGLAQGFGESRHLDAESLSWLPWETAIDASLTSASAIERSMLAKHQHVDEARLRMPMLLENIQDLRAAHLPASSGHFYGQGTVEARVILIDESSTPDMLPAHSIVAIHSADPGYEWIFLHQPVALITAYGGPHSHMALRCADAACGTVLGLGTERFHKLVGASTLRVDFEQAQIQITHRLEQTPVKQVA